MSLLPNPRALVAQPTPTQTSPTATPAPLQEYRRRGQNPDDFLPTVEALRSIPVQQLAYLLGAVLGDATSRDGSMIYSASDRACGVVRDYCRLLLVLRLVPVACHDEDTSIRVRANWGGCGAWVHCIHCMKQRELVCDCLRPRQFVSPAPQLQPLTAFLPSGSPLTPSLQVRGSTASGGRRCEQSWVLGTDGEAALDAQGQRVHPQANDWDVNILVQFLVLLGAIDGSSRTLSQRFLDNLLMQSRRVLLPVVGAAADTDGWYDKQVREFDRVCSFFVRSLPACAVIACRLPLASQHVCNYLCPSIFCILQNNAVKVGQGKLCSHDGEVSRWISRAGRVARRACSSA